MTTPAEILIVWCNCPDINSATALASGLIKEKLAACVNVLPTVQSIYHWEGKLEITHEVPLMIKTTPAAYPKLEGWLQTQHPYTIPEIIALPVAQGLPAYIAWVHDSIEKTECNDS